MGHHLVVIPINHPWPWPQPIPASLRQQPQRLSPLAPQRTAAQRAATADGVSAKHQVVQRLEELQGMGPPGRDRS